MVDSLFSADVVYQVSQEFCNVSFILLETSPIMPKQAFTLAFVKRQYFQHMIYYLGVYYSKNGKVCLSRFMLHPMLPLPKLENFSSAWSPRASFWIQIIISREYFFIDKQRPNTTQLSYWFLVFCPMASWPLLKPLVIIQKRFRLTLESSRFLRSVFRLPNFYMYLVCQQSRYFRSFFSHFQNWN